MIEQLGEHWTFLGNLSPVEMSAFFHECEVTVLPSLNSTESFGIVQVESMTCGTPVIASDLPGVRQPVLMTGMGYVVPPANADSLVRAILTVLDHPQVYKNDQHALMERFSPSRVAEEYERLFEEVRGKR
jgi:glycosyltransferase involved in cell wall biosynthesis